MTFHDFKKGTQAHAWAWQADPHTHAIVQQAWNAALDQAIQIVESTHGSGDAAAHQIERLKEGPG